MSSKLLFVLLIITLLIVLTGFNWTNTSDVSIFGFYTLIDVPIIIIMGVSFLAGSLFSISYTIGNKKTMNKKNDLIKNEELKNVSRRRKRNKRQKVNLPSHDVASSETPL